MTNEKLSELLKIAYRWGRDNGSNRSEKNFNDLLQTKAISEALRIHDVSGSTDLKVGDKIDIGGFITTLEEIKYDPYAMIDLYWFWNEKEVSIDIMLGILLRRCSITANSWLAKMRLSAK